MSQCCLDILEQLLVKSVVADVVRVFESQAEATKLLRMATRAVIERLDIGERKVTLDSDKARRHDDVHCCSRFSSI